MASGGVCPIPARGRPSTTIVKPRRQPRSGMEDTGENRFILALLLACPACVGGFLLPFGVALGASTRGLQAAAGLLILATLGVSWARNAWARRHEDRVPLNPANVGTSVEGAPG